ncbi:hypothetical protein DFH09DRAFT_1284506 [Mycena vulgaris]|nr:hypothetical protein DFH09DRAFT_1284506 [Mycena vulgaris]
MVDLAQELIEAIFAEVDDRRSLQACALASRPFVLPAQRLLFKKMSFPVDTRLGSASRRSYATKCAQRACDILSSAPHLIAFVRELKIGSMQGVAGWTALAALLRKLQPAKIERFSMEGPMDMIPSTVRVALAAIFSQPSLQHVEFRSSGPIPPSILANVFASCREVFVRSDGIETPQTTSAAYGSEGDTDTNLPLGHAIPLEHLTMATRDGAGSFLLEPEISHRIHRLQYAQIYPDALAAMHQCSTTLTHLTLYNTYDIVSPEFPRLGALRVLTMLTCMSNWPPELAFIAASLPKSLPLLKVLNLNAAYRPLPFRAEYRPDIDSALAELGCLQEICFILDGRSGPIDPLAYQSSVERVLPEAHQAGLLTFRQV